MSGYFFFIIIFLRDKITSSARVCEVVRVRARQKSGGLGNKFGKKTRFNVKAAGGGISGVKGQPVKSQSKHTRMGGLGGGVGQGREHLFQRGDAGTTEAVKASATRLTRAHRPTRSVQSKPIKRLIGRIMNRTYPSKYIFYSDYFQIKIPAD